MTISSTTRKAGPYAGNGVATSFAFAFKVFARSDVTVTLLTVATGVETVLTLDTDYTVTLNTDQNNNPGGTVTYTPAMASTHTLTLTSDVPELQGTDIQNAGGFYPEVIEDALDRAVILVQQLDEQVDRAVKGPVSDNTAMGPLPAAATRANKFFAFDAAGAPTAASGTGSDSALRTDLAAVAGGTLVGFQQAGTSAVPRTQRAKSRDIVSVLDYGVVANDASARTANTTAMRKLTATVANGGDADSQFKGNVWFPKGDTYNFNGILPFRDGIHLELSGSTLNFTAADSTAENASGFLYARRDFSCKNGYVEVDYVSTLGQRGDVFKFNARYADTDQAPGNYFLNNFEEDQAPGGTVMTWMPGLIELRNLRIKSNNPQGIAIRMFGGLKNVVMENIEIDGQSLCSAAIDYEFGGATDEVAAANELSSHGANLYLHNIFIRNFAAAGQDGTALGIRGAYNVTVDGLYCKDVKNVIAIGTGEAANANPGTYDVAGVKRNNYFRNIVGQNVTLTGIGIAGATVWSGYLAPLATQTQTNVEIKTTELLDAVVENFTLTGTAAGYGVSMSGGKITLRNGRIVGFSSGVLDSGVKHALIDTVDILDCTSTSGIRVNNSGSIYTAGWIDRELTVRNGVIAGTCSGAPGTGTGILFESGQVNALIEKMTFGYNTRATGRFTVTGGTAGAGNKLTSLTVNAAEILVGPGTDVPWTTSNTATAALIATAINAYTATSGYTAKSQGAQVLIIAAAGTGITPNGYVVVPTVAGDMTVGSIKDMSGGLRELNQKYSVFVSNGIQNITVRNCNTRGFSAGGVAYYHQDATDNKCVIDGCIGDVTFSGGWATEGAYTGTLTGCTTAPTAAIDYAQKGQKVFITVPAFTATSNAVTKTITGALPTNMRPAANEYFTCLTSDNGGAYVASSGYMTTGGVITLFKGPNDDAFTNAGVFACRRFGFFYDI